MSKQASGALFSLSLTAIGRSTHTAGSAAAHMRYVTRSGAVESVIGRGMPTGVKECMEWIDAQEAEDRSNARVCDTAILALPHQLTPEQRERLVCDWADEISGGVPYLIAIHKPSREGDQRNHHAHVVFRDRDPTTGKRVMKTTEKAFVMTARTSWERHVNAALEAAGIDARTDCRSHADRGINRLPSHHEGPAETADARREARGSVTPAGNPSAALPLHTATNRQANMRVRAINAARDRADARAAHEAGRKAQRAALAAMGIGLVPPLPPQTPSRTASPAPAERTPQTASLAPTVRPPQRAIVVEPTQLVTRAAPERQRTATALPGRPPSWRNVEDLVELVPTTPKQPEPPTPPPTPAIPAPAPAAVETEAERAARMVAEGEAWLAAERAAGRMPAAARAEPAPATTPAPKPAAAPAPARPSPPQGAATPGITRRQRAMADGLLDGLTAGSQAVASTATRFAGLVASGWHALRTPTPTPTPAPPPAAPEPASAPPPRHNFGNLAKAVTEADTRGNVRLYTTEREQERDDGGIAGVEAALRRSGVQVERKKLFEDTRRDGATRSWIALTFNQHSLSVIVSQMGDAGEALVDRLSTATRASTARYQQAIKPWMERRKAAAVAERAAARAAGPTTAAPRTRRGRDNDDLPGIT